MSWSGPLKTGLRWLENYYGMARIGGAWWYIIGGCLGRIGQAALPTAIAAIDLRLQYRCHRPVRVDGSHAQVTVMYTGDIFVTYAFVDDILVGEKNSIRFNVWRVFQRRCRLVNDSFYSFVQLRAYCNTVPNYMTSARNKMTDNLWIPWLPPRVCQKRKLNVFAVIKVKVYQ